MNSDLQCVCAEQMADMPASQRAQFSCANHHHLPRADILIISKRFPRDQSPLSLDYEVPKRKGFSIFRLCSDLLTDPDLRCLSGRVEAVIQ